MDKLTWRALEAEGRTYLVSNCMGLRWWYTISHRFETNDYDGASVYTLEVLHTSTRFEDLKSAIEAANQHLIKNYEKAFEEKGEYDYL